LPKIDELIDIWAGKGSQSGGSIDEQIDRWAGLPPTKRFQVRPGYKPTTEPLTIKSFLPRLATAEAATTGIAPIKKGAEKAGIYPQPATIGQGPSGVLDIVKAGGAGLAQGLALGYLPEDPTMQEFRGGAPTAFGVGRFLGEVAPLLTGAGIVRAGTKALPGLAGKLLAKRVPSTSATGAVFGAAKKPEEGQSRMINALTDAVAFGAFDTVLAGLGKFVAKPVLNRIREATLKGKMVEATKILQEAGVQPGQIESMPSGLQTTPDVAGGIIKNPTVGELLSSLKQRDNAVIATVKQKIEATIPRNPSQFAERTKILNTFDQALQGDAKARTASKNYIAQTYPGLGKQFSESVIPGQPFSPELAPKEPILIQPGKVASTKATSQSQGFGQSNILFTSDRKTAALKRLQEKGGRLTAGVDPSIFKDWAEIGGYYLEGGVRDFGQWSAKMVGELGEKVKPHLQKIYNDLNTTLKPIAEKAALPEGVDTSINPKRFAVSQEAKIKIDQAVNVLKPELEKVKGRTLSHDEVIEAAKASGILQRSISREKTLELEAAINRTGQAIAAGAEGKGMGTDFLRNLQTLSSYATYAGRLLESQKASALPIEAGAKVAMAKKLLNLGIDIDRIAEAAKRVDFSNAKQAALFYRKFIPATFSEKLNEFRYINLLSSPLTHIVNAFSNLLQVGILRPSVRLVSGGIDNVASVMGKEERGYYVSQVPAYYRGAFNSIGDAVSKSLKAMRGQMTIERPDIVTGHIPTYSKFTKWGYAIPRAMEAMDIFFRTMAEGGEKEALALGFKKAGKAITEADILQIEAQAKEVAAKTVFREPLDPTNKTGQGTILKWIDYTTQQVQHLRSVPGVKWVIPFLQTPMSILKQGIEYSPLGITTLAGSKQKTEQLAKSLIGSTVFAGAGWLALTGKTTWAVPTDPKEKELFYAAGMRPFAVKIGGKWISYTRLGPIAYPLAMAAAVGYYAKENPKAATDTAMEKAGKVLTAMAEFFSQQSYVQSIGDIVDLTKGTAGALPQILTGFASQVIPLSSLQRWVSHIIDPVYRKAEKGMSVEAIVENLKKGMPFLSKSVEPYLTPSGEKARRALPVLNAFSPIAISPEKAGAAEDYRYRLQQKRERLLQAQE